jgi:riboflavin kinase / FMN adenylyltransferase
MTFEDEARAGAPASVQGERPFLIAEDPAAVPEALRHCVAAIGNFDGVHRGHAAVIGRAKALARRVERPCAVITFEPHPTDFFKGPGSVFRLTPQRAKALALARLGIDGMVVVPFDARRAMQSPEAFVREVLVEGLAITAAVVGYDFHFGKARAGTPEFLREAGQQRGFGVEVVEAIRADVEGRPEALHSTAARHALEAGDVAEAARLLGHEWFVVGEVIHGEKRGREMGFPTANLRLDPSCRLRHGIYAVRVAVDGAHRQGVASFGRRPTFDNGAPLLEIFIFDFSGDLYGKTLEVAFVGWLRGEEKFEGMEPLIAQMRRDADNAKLLLQQGVERADPTTGHPGPHRA